MRYIYTIIFLIFLAIPFASVQAVGLGISPSRVILDDIVRGAHIEKEVILSRSDAREQLYFTVQGEGQVAECLPPHHRPGSGGLQGHEEAREDTGRGAGDLPCGDTLEDGSIPEMEGVAASAAHAFTVGEAGRPTARKEAGAAAFGRLRGSLSRR